MIRSCAPGWGRSLPRMTRIPSGHDARFSRPVASATNAPDRIWGVAVVGRLPQFSLVEHGQLVCEGVGQGKPDRVLHPLPGQPRQELMRAASAVGADQHRSARPAAGLVSGELRERRLEHGDVVGGGVRARVSLAQHD